MKKLELEVKILNVSKNEILRKLEKLGYKPKNVIKEKMYVYHIYGIDSRFSDILHHLNFYKKELNFMEESEAVLKRKYSENDSIKYETAFERLKNLLEELDYLLTPKEIEFLKNTYQVDKLVEILKLENYFEIINQTKIKNLVSKYFLNPHKWLRLRKSNEKVELTIKHIIPSNEFVEQIEETEVKVEDFEEMNELLESLGFQHKNYFEKERIQFEYLNCEIDIDSWPLIPTYMEIEGNSEEEIKKVLEKLGLNLSDAISCTADEVFKKYGKSMFEKRDMKFSK